MKIRSSLPLVLILALTAPIAASTAAPTTEAGNGVTVAKKKKKKTWCQKQSESMKYRDIKKVKFKRIGKQDKQKAWLYRSNYKTEYLFCSESPKFATELSYSEGIAKTGKLLAVRNNCAVFYSESKPGPSSDNGVKEVVTIPYKYFRKSSKLPEQYSTVRLGFKEDSVALQSLTLSQNCVWVAGYVKNGMPTIAIVGAGDFPYHGFREREMPGMTIPELKAITTTVLAADAVRVNWTQNGVPKSDDYPGNAR
jgi:hypothetical protein